VLYHPLRQFKTGISAMPFTDLEKKRQYHRDYMRQRRQGFTGKSLNPAQEPAKFNPNRPHRHCSIKIAGVWYSAAEQDGKVFDRGTGELLRLE
jgi:hypothetical protein